MNPYEPPLENDPRPFPKKNQLPLHPPSFYRRKIIKSSIIAFVLFFLGGTISNTGWASNIAIAALKGAAFHIISYGLVVAAFAALAAAVLALLRKRFFSSFSNIYSVTIIVVSILILFGSFS
jgi:hypothetical protein